MRIVLLFPLPLLESQRSVECMNEISENLFYKLDNDGKSCIGLDERPYENPYESPYPCRKGYEMDANGVCQDINECRQWKSRYGRCKNTPGSAKFRCRKGFRFSKEDFDCVDINECQEGTSKCDDLCDNIKGGYVCKCLGPGMKLSADGFSCEKSRTPITVDIDQRVDCGLGYKK